MPLLQADKKEQRFKVVIKEPEEDDAEKPKFRIVIKEPPRISKGQAYRAAVDSAIEAFTGRKRIEESNLDIKGLSQFSDLSTGSAGKDVKTAALLFTALDDAQRKEIFKKALDLSDEDFETDQFGTIVGTLPDGRRATVGKPGWDINDATTAAALVLEGLGVAKGVSLFKNLGNLGRRFFTGGGFAGASILSDLAADEVAGTDSGVSGKAAGLGALMGFLFPVGPRIVSGAREGIELAQKVGATPTLVTASGSRAVDIVERALGATPAASGVITKAAQRTISEIEAAAQKQTGELGAVRPQFQAGKTIQAGVERFSSGAKSVADEGLKPTADEIIAAPSRQTSFKQKASALYKKVKIDGRRKIDLKNTTAQLQKMNRALRDPKLNKARQNPFFALLEERIKAGVKIGFDDMRQIRRDVRRSGTTAELSTTLDNAQVTSLTAAMTKDLETHAGRMGHLKEFTNADKFYAAGMDRISDSLEKFFKFDRPEQAFAAFESALKEKGGDVGRVLALKRTLRTDEWNDLAATIINRMGQRTGKAIESFGEGVVQKFSAENFITNYTNMSKAAQNALFGPSARKHLDDISEFIAKQGKLDVIANPQASSTFSKIAPFLPVGGGVAGGLISPGLPGIAAGAAIVVILARAGAGAITSPGFLKTWANIVESGFVDKRTLGGFFLAARQARDETERREILYVIEGLAEQDPKLADDKGIQKLLSDLDPEVQRKRRLLN